MRTVGDVLAVSQEVKVRVNVDKSKRRIGLSMLEWSEDEASRGGRGGGGGGFDVGFGTEADKEFHLNQEEDAIAVGEFTSSPFDAAFARARREGGEGGQAALREGRAVRRWRDGGRRRGEVRRRRPTTLSGEGRRRLAARRRR